MASPVKAAAAAQTMEVAGGRACKARAMALAGHGAVLVGVGFPFLPIVTTSCHARVGAMARRLARAQREHPGAQPPRGSIARFERQRLCARFERQGLCARVTKTFHRLGHWPLGSLSLSPARRTRTNPMAAADSAVYTTLRTIGEGPGPRGGHTATLVEKNLVIMGGTRHKGNGKYEYCPLNPIVLDVETLNWFQPRLALGIGPQPRAYHSASRVGTSIFIFGGQVENAKALGDLHMFDLRRMLWEEAETTGKAPKPRYWHTSSQVGGSLFVIGGFSNGKSLSDVHVLDVETLLWSKLEVKGCPLPPMSNHSCTPVGNRVYIFGGMNVKQDKQGHSFIEYNSDTLVLDLESMSAWKQRGRGNRPKGRAYHEAVLVGGYIVLIGGWNGQAMDVGALPTLDLEGLGSWYSVAVPGKSAHPMYGHTASLIGSKIVLCGGWDGFSALSTVHVIDTTLL